MLSLLESTTSCSTVAIAHVAQLTRFCQLPLCALHAKQCDVEQVGLAGVHGDNLGFAQLWRNEPFLDQIQLKLGAEPRAELECNVAGA